MPITINIPKPANCAECGMEAVNHRAERFNLLIEALLSPINNAIGFLSRPLQSVIDTIINTAGPWAIGLAIKLGLGIAINNPDEHTTESERALWYEAVRRGITMREFRLFGLPRHIFVAHHGGRKVVFEKVPLPTRNSATLTWIDDKAKMKGKFLAKNFPIARGGKFRDLEKPVIVKPQFGSGGRHTTVGITTETQLDKAITIAKQISPWVVVEEQLVGPVYRATLINRKLAAVLRRDPAHVIGDGIHTIKALVEEENKNPLRAGPVFAPIIVPSTIDEYLIPAYGEITYLNWKVNWGVGGTSRDATAEVHRDNKKLFEDVAEYLDDVFIGIDFMISDISHSWRETSRCGIIECNSMPFIGNHHYPYTGPVVNVAGMIWDLVLPEAKISDHLDNYLDIRSK